MKKIRKVKDADDIETVSKLAKQIWTEHYVPIIGRKQVEYMLDEFQSPEAISSQVEKGCEYFLLEVDGKAVGYLALVEKNNNLKISKIYVRSEYRGNGLGTYLMNFARQKAKERNLERIWLRVNKDNDSSIEWYKKQGFSIKEANKKSIGQGYFMDDFVMSKRL